ncbi:GNAT family N-acetyltransferase [Streptomyces rubiginosohelvolus]|uniref:GNAT family N-acetyltransferase n=1 Tax=Streptomyces rubiginosohelvolus TaxID=67362 RepID=UPI00341F4B8F
MSLTPFSAADAAAVAGWPTTSEEVSMWCGRKEFPFEAEIVSSWSKDDDVHAYLLAVNGELVGYGEVWLDAEEEEVELARIIVAPDARGKGLGRSIVQGLLAHAQESGYSDIFMRVYPNNEKALRCYLGAGFAPVTPDVAENWNASQPVSYIWLQHHA